MENTRTFPVNAELMMPLTERAGKPWQTSDGKLTTEIEIRGVTLGLVYDPAAQTLAVTIRHKPFYVSTAAVWEELDKYRTALSNSPIQEVL